MGQVSFHDEISKNNRNSALMAVLVFVVLVVLAYVIGLVYDPSIAFLFIMAGGAIAIFQILNAYYNGDKIVLSTTGAIPADEKKYMHLHNVVDGLAIAAGIPKPKVYVIDSTEMNAFATGRDPQHSSIAVTTGLLNTLNRSELEGVIGHEMSHIQNNDIRFAMFIAVLVGLIAIVSYIFLRSFRFGSGNDRKNGGAIFIIIGLVLAIVAPIIVRLIQLAISRQREYLADASGAALTRYPDGLASALEKIGKTNKGNMNVSEGVSHIFFVDPVYTFIDKITSTHPPIQDRVKRLRAM